MDPYSYRLEEINLAVDSRKTMVHDFLRQQDLSPDPALTKYFAVCKGNDIVGGAGYDRNVIKCAAVKGEYRGEGLLNAVITLVMKELRSQGHENIFVFTKPGNRVFFGDLGFSPIGETGDVILMENGARAFQKYLQGIARHKRSGITGALVMNCNPFTKGHLFLVERAAECCDRVIIFLVEEDVSEFPFPVRMHLLRRGTEHIPNIVIVPSGPYVISSATFPTYFLKDESGIAAIHAELDLIIFGRHIAAAGGITKRFVGEEPFSSTTNIYNSVMRERLPALGVDVVIFPRYQVDGECVSATTVRKLLKKNDLASAKRYVPESTYKYLVSTPAALSQSTYVPSAR